MISDPSSSRVEEPAGLAQGARQRRERLRRVMADLERTLASPARQRFDPWLGLLVATLRDLDEALRDHIAETEADDGLFARTVDDAPRLANTVERLREQHADLVAQADALTRRAGGAGEDDVDDLRDEGTALLVLLASHRQLGADLLYEAYFVDVGSSE